MTRVTTSRSQNWAVAAPGSPGAVYSRYQPDTRAQRRLPHEQGKVIIRILQRILALTTAIWHNDKTAAQTTGP